MHSVSIFSAYYIAVGVCVVVFLLSVLVANMIKYQPGVNPKDRRKRKVWFWLLSVLALILPFIVEYFVVYQGIKSHAQQDKYMLAMCIASVVSFVLYILLGVIVSKIFRTSKVGNWF